MVDRPHCNRFLPTIETHCYYVPLIMPGNVRRFRLYPGRGRHTRDSSFQLAALHPCANFAALSAMSVARLKGARCPLELEWLILGRAPEYLDQGRNRSHSRESRVGRKLDIVVRAASLAKLLTMRRNRKGAVLKVKNGGWELAVLLRHAAAVI